MAHVGKVSMDGERQFGSRDHVATLSDLGRGDVQEGYGYCVIDNLSGSSLRCQVGWAVFSLLVTCHGIIKCKNMQFCLQ